MNLNKFTKAELISKFKTLDSKVKSNSSAQSSQTISSLSKTLFSSIITTIIHFKSFLLKFTLITLFLKYFKRYSLFRKLWYLTNWMVMGIFGKQISLFI